MSKYKRMDRHISNCNGLMLSGPAHKIMTEYERYGYDADRNKDYRLAHMYWQYAEHFKKMVNNNDR